MKNSSLEDYPFYNELDHQSALFLEKNLKPIEIPKGNILFFQGDICDNILFLTQGVVRLYIQSDEAEEITLYELNKGEQCVVNTASTLSSSKAIGSAISLTDIEGYLLDTFHVKELAKMSNIYQDFLFSLYTIRLTELAKLVHDIKFKRLDARILEYLQAHKTQKIETTHEYIANELGTTRVVVSRILKELEKEEKLILTRGFITLM